MVFEEAHCFVGSPNSLKFIFLNFGANFEVNPTMPNVMNPPKITDGIKILEIKELIPQVKRKPAGKPHGKQQKPQFAKKKGYTRH